MENGTKNHHLQKRWIKIVFEWQPGLDPTLRTKRSVGRPKGGGKTISTNSQEQKDMKKHSTS